MRTRLHPRPYTATLRTAGYSLQRTRFSMRENVRGQLDFDSTPSVRAFRPAHAPNPTVHATKIFALPRTDVEQVPNLATRSVVAVSNIVPSFMSIRDRHPCAT